MQEGYKDVRVRLFSVVTSDMTRNGAHEALPEYQATLFNCEGV